MLLQQALKQRLKSIREIEAALKKILHSKDTVKRLYESNLTYNEIESELQTFIPKLMTFIEEYLSDSPINRPRPHNWQGKICEIDDIEENLWCPELGIKGKIDVTTRTESGITPLEVKSGRATMSLEHRGQVILYIMMMNKFGYQVSSGLLLYLRYFQIPSLKLSFQLCSQRGCSKRNQGHKSRKKRCDDSAQRTGILLEASHRKQRYRG
jgi:DNA replication ATP-dependent helicase Dna2